MPEFPHCDLNALFEGTCDILYKKIAYDMNNTMMGNHRFNVNASDSVEGHRIRGEAVAKFGNTTWVDYMGFDLETLRPSGGRESCVMHSFSWSTKEE
jgi:hypothetical protein